MLDLVKYLINKALTNYLYMHRRPNHVVAKSEWMGDLDVS
jgi:hypothetical protein